MKKMLFLTLASLLVVPVAVRAQGMKIGTVDMNRTFREYNKTKDAEAKINDAKNQAKKEYDERADAYKKALDDLDRHGGYEPDFPRIQQNEGCRGEDQRRQKSGEEGIRRTRRRVQEGPRRR